MLRVFFQFSVFLIFKFQNSWLLVRFVFARQSHNGWCTGWSRTLATGWGLPSPARRRKATGRSTLEKASSRELWWGNAGGSVYLGLVGILELT